MTRPVQQPLDLASPPDATAFVQGAANAAALEAVESDAPLVTITGPALCGKTHLAQLFSNSGWRVADDADLRAPDPALLLEMIGAREDGVQLLLTASQPVSDWPAALPDITSRVRAGEMITIAPPSDDMLGPLLAKFCADRQLNLSADVATWLIRRLPRTYAALHRAVEIIDQAALEQKRPVTVPLVRALSAELGIEVT